MVARSFETKGKAQTKQIKAALAANTKLILVENTSTRIPATAAAKDAPALTAVLTQLKDSVFNTQSDHTSCKHQQS